MKLTAFEEQICEKYGRKTAYTMCCDCPLNIVDGFGMECYATIDGRKAKGLKRYDSEEELQNITM